METKVIGIENEDGETPRVILRCSEGETVAAKATLAARAIMVDQELLVSAIDRINVVGKGRPTVHVGDTVQVLVISTAS